MPMQVKWSCVSFIWSHLISWDVISCHLMSSHVISCHLISCRDLLTCAICFSLFFLWFRLSSISFFHLASLFLPFCLLISLLSRFPSLFYLAFLVVLVLVLVLVRCVSSLLSSSCLSARSFARKALRRSHCCDRICKPVRCRDAMLIDAILVAISRGSKLRYYQAQGTAMCHLLPLMIPLLQPFGLSNYSEHRESVNIWGKRVVMLNSLPVSLSDLVHWDLIF